MEPKAFEVYRHFKGNLYQVITLAEEEETGNKLVIYQGLYAPFKVYARPLSAFLEKLDRTKYPGTSQEYRFERVVQTEALQTGSVQAEPLQTESLQTDSVQAEPVQKKSLQTDSVQAEPVQTEPVQTEALQTESVQIESVQTGPLQPAENLGERAAEVIPAAHEKDISAGGVNPDLLLFLDAREPEEKLDALFRIKERLTPDMMTILELSQGMEPQETWSLEDRYKHIKNNIITKQKYEQKRI